jgi:hypothetical protein
MDSDTEKLSTCLKRLFPFNLLGETELIAISPLFEIAEYSKDSSVFSSGEVPDYLYFILSGNVKVISHSPKTKGRENDLATGDHFGEEVLSSTDYRLSDAMCMTDTRLLRINKEDLSRLRNQYPAVNKAFNLIYRTYKFWTRLDLPWLGNDEKVLLISRRHSFFLFLRIILVGGAGLIGSGFLLSLAITPTGVSVGLLVLALFILFFGSFITAWAALEWTNDYFFITSERVLAQKKIAGFYDSRQESPYSAILSTGLESTIWGRAIGYGTIHLRSYTGDLSFKRLPFPDVIYELLEFQRHRAARETRQQDRGNIRETLQKRLDGTAAGREHPALSDLRPDITTTYSSGSILDLLARFYGLRQEKSGSVIYRTHWWILLGKILIPSLILTGVVIFVILKLAGLIPLITDTQAYAAALLLTLVSWGWWLFQYFDWHNDIYIITPDQLVDVNRKPLGKEERRSAPIKNIQTVEFKRKGIIGLMLNFGTVRIQIGNEELTFDNVYNPASIQAEIFAYFKKYNQRIRKLEQDKLVDWIKTYDEIRKTDQDSSDKREKNG